MSTQTDDLEWQDHFHLWLLLQLAYDKANVRSFAEQGRALSRESMALFVIENAMTIEDLEQYVLATPSNTN